MMDSKDLETCTELLLYRQPCGEFGEVIAAICPDCSRILRAKDCTKMLGYPNCKKALNTYVWDEYIVTIRPQNIKYSVDGFKIDDDGEVFIKGPGYSQLMLNSDLPQAADFTKFILETVIPEVLSK